MNVILHIQSGGSNYIKVIDGEDRIADRYRAGCKRLSIQ